MKCTEAEALIHKELDGHAAGRELSEEERTLLDAHLAECERCAAMRRGMSRLTAAAKGLLAEHSLGKDFAETVTATLRRRRQFRVALGAGLAAAALVLVCVALRHQTAPAEFPRPSAERGATSRQAPAPQAREPEAFSVPTLDEAIALLEVAWQDARTQLEADVSSVQISLLPEDFAWQGELQRDLEQTGTILLQVTRQVGAQVFPFGSSQADSKPQNG